MILAIAYSHRDVLAALRLLKWIGFLSFKHGLSMKKERLLLIANNLVEQRPAHHEIIRIAPRIFGEARCFVPSFVPETGWPEACNVMFAEALLHIQRHFQDDMLWVEPDAVPVVPAWYDLIKSAYAIAVERGKIFMGARALDHMSGNGVYGANWQLAAPSLTNAPPRIPWDCHSGKDVVPCAHFTTLIQHEIDAPAVALNQIEQGTVLYHKDKNGLFIRLLDAKHYDGEADELYAYSKWEEPRMRKFYRAENANRRINSGGFSFIFEPYENFGGTWRGVYTTEDNGEMSALNSVTADARTAVTEISQSEYEAYAKKKAPVPSQQSDQSKTPLLQGAIIQSPAVLVVEPEPHMVEPEAPLLAALQVDNANLDEVIETGPVQLAPPSTIEPGIKPKGRRGRKSPLQ